MAKIALCVVLVCFGIVSGTLSGELLKKEDVEITRTTFVEQDAEEPPTPVEIPVSNIIILEPRIVSHALESLAVQPVDVGGADAERGSWMDWNSYVESRQAAIPPPRLESPPVSTENTVYKRSVEERVAKKSIRP